MKIAPLLVASTSALETSTSASVLLAAVGKRNVTHMEALVQGLAEESIKAPDNEVKNGGTHLKFEDDIQEALKAINDMFVKSIQKALMDAHKTDQEAHNCFVRDCFGDCQKEYDSQHTACRDQIAVCEQTQKAHEECREDVYNKYKTMAKACGALHCFEPTKPICPEESCICEDVRECHFEQANGKCSAKTEECMSDPKEGYGAWLQKMIQTYTSEWQTWQDLHKQCSDAYQAFLLEDLECDGIQREFETCMCQQEHWESSICEQDYAQCNAQCKAFYDESTPNIKCQEKDRKIDWSATKKIECYLDVLLHEYTPEELLKECGSATCINQAREAAYKHCGTICPNVDHDGQYPDVKCFPEQGKVEQVGGKHHLRKYHDEYHLGDDHIPKVLELPNGEYACDLNGAPVHTNARSDDRKKEGRCTEHLDIDFQTINIRDCKEKPNTVCDADWHCKYYAKFDDPARIGCITDCCSDGSGKGCDGPESFLSCKGGDGSYEAGVSISEVHELEFAEHTHAWAYNRCPCKDCVAKPPAYPGGTEDHCYGIHSANFKGIRNAYES